MAKFIIEGGIPLEGEVTPSGNKNAALPLLAASLLTDEPLVLKNVPFIGDVKTMLALLEDLGVEISFTEEKGVILKAQNLRKTSLREDLCRQIRASILLAGPMLARCGRVKLGPPGGDVIGRRRLDTHFLAFQAMGAEVDIDARYYLSADSLQGADILLDEASVTGTENVLMAAVLAKGTTVIRNAASEPHVQDLARCLNQMGAKISGIGSNVLIVEGVDRLHGTTFEIPSDHIEVGSFIGLAAATRGQILIRKAVPENMRMSLMVFERLGVKVEVRGEDILVPAEQEMVVKDEMDGSIPKIEDGPWPAFPADLMSIAIVTATQACGTVLFFEKMFESRLFFVDKLIAMGARIILCDPHRAVVVGPSRLRGEQVSSPDIRAGMALIIAALCARGRSEISNIEQVDRGYENIDEKLKSLGARIERVS
ncbi:MAG: UDP-N-acetylglucosamine 1-carboxyvinyltransferase [Anaerolineae bacterium]|nr:UDP-N-acetylglucosamine 1-carboxyvinyltransferase [Anaerolineae bacterium]